MPTSSRRVAKRKPAKPISTPTDRTPGLKGHLKRFFMSFTPSRFKAYWLSRAGMARVGKIIGVGALFVVLVFLWYAKDLPSPSKINAQIGLTTTFYARDELTNPGHGTKLYEVHGNEQRVVINFDQMPDSLKHATVAVEDRNFYKEGAFSFISIFRATLTDLIHHGAYQGGSTITQQYVKNSLLTNDRSISRKIKELILSVEISQFYSKDDILKLYLNEIPYGNGAYGVEAACRTYFSKAPANYGTQNCAQHLNLGQSALLAAIPNAPSYYSPYGEHKADLIARQNDILDKMAAQGYITQAQADGSKWTLAQLDTSTAGNATRQINQSAAFFTAVTAPNFVFTVQDQLEAQYGASTVESGGWKVITTLDPNLQKCAELSVYNPGNDTCTPDGKTAFNPNKNDVNYKNLTALGGSNAALVAADPKTGQVLSMVGSYSFTQDQNNVATLKRPPGSSFKPYVYATLFEKNMTAGCTSNTAACDTYGAGSILNDTIAEGDSFSSTYHPRDFGGGVEVGGPVTIRTALNGSLNIPAVQALKLAGTTASIATAHSLGITTTIPDNDLSIVLGDGDVKLADHVNAYESFANGGVHYAPTMVLKITDAKGNTIEDDTKPKTPKKVLDPQAAYLIANILSDSTARQYVFGSLLQIPGHVGGSQAGQGVAVKTGTTTDVRDAWTIGFSPSIVAGVWAGNDNNGPMSDQAVNISGPIWTGFMTAALMGKPMETFAKPDGLQYLPLPGPALKSTSPNDYFPKWYKAIVRKMVNIDKVSGKLATSCTPPLAIQNVLDTGITDSDDVHSCNDTQPTVQLSGLTGGGPYNFTATVALGTFGTSKPGIGTAQLVVTFNDQIVSTQDISASGSYNISYTPPSDGTYIVKATITDTGLYQGSDQKTVVAGATSSSFKGLTPNSSSSPPAGSVVFSWTDDSKGAYQLFVDGSPKGAPTNGTVESAQVLTKNVTHHWYVTDSAGNSTAPIAFTVQ
ncbi:penicillin-binding protein [Candidatus Saccharibacteria bacterium]|nr:penicillin-binding protein [Candidatus Saccharibacteria bacterium]